ncbi:hypothetical protein FQN55_004687 [Onygenales sp. PD_40]|nr:hypothetical protein FQN55_004687 [Onygenales sp. PD_40]
MGDSAVARSSDVADDNVAHRTAICAENNSEIMTTNDDDDTLHLFRSDCLEQNTEEHDFTTTTDLKRRVRYAKGQLNATTPDLYILFHHVSPERAVDIWNRSISLVSRSRLAYDAVSNVLIVKLVSRPHEHATHRIDLRIKEEVSSMGLRNELQYTGASRVSTDRSEKEPDGSYLPMTLPQGRTDKWPSVVIETAYSELASKLRADAAWWLLASDGDVRLVIAVNVSPRRPRIVTELWESVLVDNRRGGRSRRPQSLQSITVELQNNLPVSSGPLTIPFDRLFLRPPVPPQEHDLIFPPPELETIASVVWRNQGFL